MNLNKNIITLTVVMLVCCGGELSINYLFFYLHYQDLTQSEKEKVFIIFYSK